MQEGKTWNKCFNYIVEQARKQSNGRSTAVEGQVVYEWAEDYYHKEEKPEAKKKVSDKKQVDTVNKAKPAVKKVETQKNSSEKQMKNCQRKIFRSQKRGKSLKRKKHQRSRINQQWMDRCHCSIFCRRRYG